MHVFKELAPRVDSPFIQPPGHRPGRLISRTRPLRLTQQPQYAHMLTDADVPGA